MDHLSGASAPRQTAEEKTARIDRANAKLQAAVAAHEQEVRAAGGAVPPREGGAPAGAEDRLAAVVDISRLSLNTAPFNATYPDDDERSLPRHVMRLAGEVDGFELVDKVGLAGLSWLWEKGLAAYPSPPPPMGGDPLGGGGGAATVHVGGNPLDAPAAAALGGIGAPSIGGGVAAAALVGGAAVPAPRHGGGFSCGGGDENVRAIDKAFRASISAAADATAASTASAAAADTASATPEAVAAAAILGDASASVIGDFVASAEASSANADDALRTKRDAKDAWRQAVVVQGNTARAGARAVALAQKSAAEVAVEAAEQVVLVADAFSYAAATALLVTPALKAEAAAEAVVSTAKVVARGETELCVNAGEVIADAEITADDAARAHGWRGWVDSGGRGRRRRWTGG